VSKERSTDEAPSSVNSPRVSSSGSVAPDDTSGRDEADAGLAEVTVDTDDDVDPTAVVAFSLTSDDAASVFFPAVEAQASAKLDKPPHHHQANRDLTLIVTRPPSMHVAGS